MIDNSLKWTGERMTTEYFSYGSIEHLHRYSIISEFLDKNMIIMDIACGEGYGTNILSKKVKKAIGVDVSMEAISHAKNKYSSANIEFIHSSAINIPIEDNCIDVIVSFETIEHIEDHEKLLSEFKRVLRKNGLLIISTPDKQFYSKGNPNPYHIKELSFAEFEMLLSNYFINKKYVFQKTFHGSIIFNTETPSNLEYYEGNFDRINHGPAIIEPEFIIAFVSDSPNHNIIFINSVFNAWPIYEKETQENLVIRTNYYNLISSRKFKIINKILKILNIGFIIITFFFLI